MFKPTRIFIFALCVAIATAQLNDARFVSRTRDFNTQHESSYESDFVEIDTIPFIANTNSIFLGLKLYYGTTNFLWGHGNN